MKEVTVSDATDTPVEFTGLKTDHGIFVLVDQEPNGFGWPKGVQFSDSLKLLGNGKYGA